MMVIFKQIFIPIFSIYFNPHIRFDAATNEKQTKMLSQKKNPLKSV
jgi:hypothetical protein